jgi:hypothetical protein
VVDVRTGDRDRRGGAPAAIDAEDERRRESSEAERERRESERERHEIEREREETTSIVATSVAAVATAWTAFQASIWGGTQTFSLAESNKARQLSIQARLEGDDQRQLDTSLFVTYAGAYANGNQAFAQFLIDRFPARLRKATDAWLATHPFTSRDAPPYPMAMGEYKVEAYQHATDLAEQADRALARSQVAHHVADVYVLGTVVFATNVLLASLGLRLHGRKPRRVMLVFSLATLVVALVWLATRPIVWTGG